MRMKKQLLALGLAVCLGAGSGLTAYATQTGQEAEDNKEADTPGTLSELMQELSTETLEEALRDSYEEADSAGADASGSADSDASGSTDSDASGSTDIRVTPSDANALLLMDAGAQSPRGVPGQEVEVWLTLAVNREYLPSEKYVLRNITVSLDIPTSGTTDVWPFDVVNASYVKHLDDMTYNSTEDVRYKLRISEFAKEGVYPVNFTVNATVWREDSVNGTAITEDVEFPMNVFVTVAENGNMSGVTSNIGPLELAGREDTAIASPTGKPGQSIVMSIPIVNKGMTLTNVTVAPVVTGSLDTFPFVTTDINYGRELGTMENGDRQTVDWPMTISPYATTGNKVVTFRATYEENGVYGECTFNAYVYVTDGYVQESAPSLTVESYELYADGEKVESVEAGSDVVLKVILKNNAVKDTIYKTVATLKITDANSLILSSGYSNMAYVRSIPAGQTEEIEYHITARASASVGPSAATINLTYENQDVIQGSAVSNIQIPIKQPMNLQLDTPIVYGNAVQGEPVAVTLHMTNLGRSRAYNVKVLAMDGIRMQDTWFGGDILAAGSLDADLEVIPGKSGTFTGTLTVQYEDADGEIYMQNAALELTAEEPQLLMEANADMEQAVKESAKSAGSAWQIAALGVVLVLVLILLLLNLLLIRRKKQEGADREKL